ncbi:MAG: hypothetical protein JXB43_05955 [Dehalococcoidia bacterium]|nr:hypothetical protein [Dehalococcoidia bacterium]
MLEQVASKAACLKLNPGYLGQVREMRKGKTLFQKIEIVEPAELISESIKELPPISAAQHSAQPQKIAEEIVCKLVGVIEKAWDVDKFHIMFHSSGYDSRIISGILSKLRRKNGDSWIGNILFLCIQPEGQLFKEIMQLEEWKPSQYIVFHEDIPAVDYRAGLVDFTSCWKWANDAQPPVAAWGFAIETLMRNCVIPENCSNMQLISGSFGSETLDPKYTRKYTNFVDDLLQINYYHRYSAAFSALLHLYGDFIIPFVHADVLASAIKAQPITDIRHKILAEISPQLLNIKRYSGSLGYDDPYHFLSAKVRQDVETKYRNSWYAKNVCLLISRPPSTVFTQPWWSSYTAASLCENLIGNGSQIRSHSKIQHVTKLWTNRLDRM